MQFEPLQTQRLLIRRFQSDDWHAVHYYMSDPDITYYLPEGRLSAAETREFVVNNTGADAEALAVTLKADQVLIGHMLFHPWFTPRVHEIGWVLHHRYHGQGYATEAARALLEYAFETLHVHRVIATCQPENVASWRVMEKLGMRREAHFRKVVQRGGDVWWDEYFYAILKEEWVERRAEGP